MKMHSTHILLPACAALALACASPSANARPLYKVCAIEASCGIAEAVDDHQLARVAGKFTIAGQVVGMRLDMNSSWQASNGQRLEAAAGIEIALPGSGRAGARFDAQANAVNGAADDTRTASEASVYLGQGLRSTRGIGQVIQVAGDSNGAANHAVIQVVQAPSAFGSANGQASAGANGADGVRASVEIGARGVFLDLTLPGAGNASQQVNIADSGAIRQHIQIAAHDQQVVNRMQLQLQVQPATRTAIAMHGMGNALNMLRVR